MQKIATYLNKIPKVAEFCRWSNVQWMHLFEKNKYFEKIKDAVEKAEKNGFIYNAEYKDLKNRMEAGMHSDSIDFLLMKANEKGIHGTTGFNDIYFDVTFSGLHALKSAIKKAKNWKKVYLRGPELDLISEYLEKYEPLLAVAQYMDDLKTKIKMGREPKPPNPNVFIPPPTKAKDQAKIEAIIKDFLVEIKKELSQIYTIKMKSVVNNYLDYQKSNKTATIYTYASAIKDPIVLAFLSGYHDDPSFIPDKVDELVEDAVSRFIAKNKQKLTYIVTRKGNLVHARMGKLTHSGIDLTGDMFFEFADNSSFKTTNKIVFVVNNKGTRFYRFPTTFHDIVLDGKKYKMQSEEWMVKNFK